MTYRSTNYSPDQVHYDGAGLRWTGLRSFLNKDAVAAAAGFFAATAIEVCTADNAPPFSEYGVPLAIEAVAAFTGIALFHKISVPAQLPRSMQNYHIVIDKSGQMPSDEALRTELQKREYVGTMLTVAAFAIATAALVASGGITPAVAATFGYALGRMRWDQKRFHNLYNADRSERWSVQRTSSAPPLSGNDTSAKDLDAYAASQDDGYQDGGNDMLKAKRPLSAARVALNKPRAA